MKRFRLFKKWG